MELSAVFVLVFHYSAEARQLGQAAIDDEPRHHQVDFDPPTDGPRRRLLATRTVTGKVTWADNGQPVSLAYVKGKLKAFSQAVKKSLTKLSKFPSPAFDNDVIGRETMGSVQTKADGTYTLTYTAKDWDSCCFSSTNPDIILEVWVGSDMYYKSGENANVNANIVRNIALQRYVASGTVMYYETCAGAYQARLTLLDEDIGNDDSMGGTVIGDTSGKYSITASKMDDGSTWDILNGNPDVFIEISAPTMESSQPYLGAYSVVGKTAVKNDIASNVLNFPTVYVWRGDKNSSAIAIQKSIPGAGKQDYVSVTEYGACSPKRMVVTIKLDINKATFSAPSDAQVTKLKALLKKGIEDNWSRTGTRALNVAGKGVYDVKVKVVESSDGYPVKLSWASTVEKECERSNNPGVLALSMSMWYNYGCEKFADPVGW
jgi:hypothetical protein